MQSGASMRSKILYIILSYSIQLLNILLNLVFMQRLPVSLLGDVAIAKIWLQSFDYTHLGTRFALDRYLPMAKIDGHRNAYLLFSLLVSFFCSLAILLIALIIENINVTIFSFCLVGISLAVINVIKAYFRATENIKSVNILMGWLYVFPLTVSFFASLYSFNAFILVYPVSFWGSMIILLLKYRFDINFDIKFRYILAIKRKMIGTSKFLFINSVIIYLSFVIDRLFVDWSLGRDALGSYSIIMFVFASIFSIPSILTELIYPKIIRSTVKEKKLFHWKESALVCFGTSVVILIANISMYYLVERFTKYSELVPLMQLAAIGVIPYSCIAILNHVFNALDKRGLLFIINLFSLFIYVLFLFVAHSLKQIDIFVFAKITYGFVLLGAMALTLRYSKI
ncbi:MATE family efflux transporter [Aeromonas caviae]|uniref:hypothetical protein n=1 Tax=Aeromonas caviae TaxID=648 RepID=UPI002B4824AE|nr:hypothetical protein [Aeromonas caviae]